MYLLFDGFLHLKYQKGVEDLQTWYDSCFLLSYSILCQGTWCDILKVTVSWKVVCWSIGLLNVCSKGDVYAGVCGGPTNCNSLWKMSNIHLLDWESLETSWCEYWAISLFSDHISCIKALDADGVWTDGLVFVVVRLHCWMRTVCFFC